MAFRLIEDLGICIDGQKYAGLVQLYDEDIEIRRRLFWSCYFWDKMISLYLGRSPTLQHSSVSPPQIMCQYLSAVVLFIAYTYLQWMIRQKMSFGVRMGLYILKAWNTHQHRPILYPAS